MNNPTLTHSIRISAAMYYACQQLAVIEGRSCPDEKADLILTEWMSAHHDLPALKRLGESYREQYKAAYAAALQKQKL